MQSHSACVKPRALALAITIAATLGAACTSAVAQDGMPFEACIDVLRRERSQHDPQVSAETFETHAPGARDLRPAIQSATESQPEFKLSIWDYTARLVDARRIADGQDVLAAQASPLGAIASRHGVDAATAVAVFGVETDYGRVEGRHRVIDATLSRACLDLTSKERKRHFFAALWLLQEGLVQPDAFRGSWAGAFGLTQFMPGTFVTYMDDGDASGTVDIIGSTADALATTAKYIAASGWTEGLRWGVEVVRPAGAAGDWVAAEREHACLAPNAPLAKCRTIEEWASVGVAAVAGRGDAHDSFGLPNGTRAALLAPGGDEGPAWLVTRNFHAIWQYNRADAYALAIGLLSDALRGDPPMRTAWATDDAGLSRAELRQLQQQLIRLGHTEVVADGFDGPRTRQAIRAEERLRGWPETGRAGARMARVLKDEPAAEKELPPPAAADETPPSQPR
jgi:lytic murein transglycosylase